MVVEVQAGAGLGDRNTRPVGARGIDNEKVVAGRDFQQGVVGEEPPQVLGHGLGVAEDSLCSQGTHQAQEGRGGADGVAVRANVGSDGDAVERLQEVRDLPRRVVSRLRGHSSLPP